MSMDRLQLLMNSIDKWSTEQFNQDRNSITDKLDEELNELKYVEMNSPSEILELADCFHLLLDYAAKLSINATDLITAIEFKHFLNKRRNWEKTGDSFHHIT